MYAVILAGGGGTRLHPLSRPERPKPFLPLLGRHSLLQLTVARLLDGGELALRPQDVTVVTHTSYVRHVEDQLPGIAVLAEPHARNTAAAAWNARRRGPGSWSARCTLASAWTISTC